MITVNNGAAAKVVVLWWLLSLVFVRVLTEIQFAAPLLEAVRQVVPAAQKYANASGFDAATTGFYCFFLISTPFVARYYFGVITLQRPLSGVVQLIMWVLILTGVFALTIGFDLGPTPNRGFGRLFNSVLTSSWFGSSFVFWLFWHCLLAAIVCIAKDMGSRAS